MDESTIEGESAADVAGRLLKPKGAKGNKEIDLSNSPTSEYSQIGLAPAYLITTLRMSMGDFGFDTANMLSDPLNGIYWALWLIIVVVTNIVFLNFIIAEACSSYENVACNLNAFILMERAALIQESEEMTFKKYKNGKSYPKYIVVR